MRTAIVLMLATGALRGPALPLSSGVAQAGSGSALRQVRASQLPLRSGRSGGDAGRPCAGSPAAVLRISEKKVESRADVLSFRHRHWRTICLSTAQSE